MGKKALEATPEAFRWIVDGHNIIFALPSLERLQTEGRRAEARARLEDLLESFGRAIGSQIWLVFDGRPDQPFSVSPSRPHLRTIYSNPPAEADDQICALAAQCVRAGDRVAVATSDRKTLVPRLPDGAQTILAPSFVALLLRVIRPPEKWSAGDLSDVERALLERSPFESDRRHAQHWGDPEDDGSDPGTSGSPTGCPA